MASHHLVLSFQRQLTNSQDFTMKTIICLVLVAVVVVAAMPHMPAHPPDTPDPEFKKKMAEFEVACKASENATQEDIDASKDHKVPTTPTGKCFVGCMMEHLGMLENGAFSQTSAEEKAKKKFADAPDKLEKILEGIATCATEVGDGTDKCETGPKVLACMEKAHDKPPPP